MCLYFETKTPKIKNKNKMIFFYYYYFKIIGKKVECG